MAEQAGLARLLEGQSIEKNGFSNLHFFGLLSKTCTPDLVLNGTHEILARALHAAYLQNHRPDPDAARLDPSFKPWDELALEKQEDNRAQADRWGKHLKQMGYIIIPSEEWIPVEFSFSGEELEQLAQFEHDAWRERMIARKWRYQPGLKDESRRTNPNLVTWHDLPEKIKEYNRASARSLPGIIQHAGLKIIRLS